MTLRISAAIFTLALLAACKSEAPVSGKLEDVVEARATITSVDMSKRLMTLRDEDGVEVLVEASKDVGNLDQIHAGDQVVVSYTQAISWQVKNADQGSAAISSSATLAVPKPGEKPAAGIGRSVTLTASITGIDLANNSVTLTGPTGNSFKLKARNPENLKRVKVGNLVDITYSEALAVGVHPVAKKSPN